MQAGECSGGPTRRLRMTPPATPDSSVSNGASGPRVRSWLERLTRHPLIYALRPLLGLDKPVYLETDFFTHRLDRPSTMVP